MSVLDREEINAFTKEIVEATTDAAKEAILAQLAASGVVKSVQSGIVNMNGDGGKQVASVSVNINAVNRNKAVIINTGWNSQKADYGGGILSFVSDTQIKAERPINSYYASSVGWMVVEFY